MNKQIKENDKELEKVNQLLGKAHKEADAKARKEQLLQEKDIASAVGTGTKSCRKWGKGEEVAERKTNLERYTNLENLQRNREGFLQIEKWERMF